MHQLKIKDILTSHARLGTDIAELQSDSDLYDAGLTSLTTVNVMLAIEDGFDIEFPDHMLSRATFQSIDSLSDAVNDLLS